MEKLGKNFSTKCEVFLEELKNDLKKVTEEITEQNPTFDYFDIHAHNRHVFDEL